LSDLRDRVGCLLLLLFDSGWLLAFSLLRVVAAGDGQHCGDCNGQHDQRWCEDA